MTQSENCAITYFTFYQHAKKIKHTFKTTIFIYLSFFHIKLFNFKSAQIRIDFVQGRLYNGHVQFVGFTCHILCIFYQIKRLVQVLTESNDNGVVKSKLLYSANLPYNSSYQTNIKMTPTYGKGEITRPAFYSLIFDY